MAGVGGYGKEDMRSTFACARNREAGVSQEAFHEVLMNHHDTLNTNTSFFFANCALVFSMVFVKRK